MTTFEKTWQFGYNYKADTSSTTNSNRNVMWWFKALLKGDLPIRRSTKATSGDAVAHAEVAGTTQDLITQGMWTCLVSSDATNFGYTTIASGSNGASLPQATINVTTNVTTTPQTFPASGVIYVVSSNGLQAIAYTGTTSSTFTGCTGGTGTLSTGNGVYDGQDRWGTIGGTTLNLGGNAGTTNSGSAASFTTGATIAGAVRMTGLANMTANDVGNFLTITGADPANLSPNNTPFKIVNFVSATSVDVYNPFGATTDTHNGSIVWTERTAYTTPASFSTVTNASGAHSWIVLRSPTALGPYYLTIDWNQATSTNMSMSVSKNIPGNGFGTVSTSTCPTASDTTTFNNVAFYNQNNAAVAMHGMLSTDGYFNFLTTRYNVTSNSGNIEGVWFFQVVADAKAADQYPFVMYQRFSNAAIVLNYAGIASISNWMSRSFNGATSLVNLNGTTMLYNSAIAVGLDMPTADFTDSQYDDWPVYVFNSGLGQQTLKGRLVDIRQTISGLPEGFTEPNPSSPSSVIVGNHWFPCNVSILF